MTHPTTSCDPSKPSLGTVLSSAVQNGIVKHATQTGTLPRSVRGSFRVRIDGRSTEYTLTVKAVGGAA